MRRSFLLVCCAVILGFSMAAILPIPDFETTAKEKELTAVMLAYEKATNSNRFSQVSSLLAPDAVYWFGDSSYQGMQAIQKYFERSWHYLPDEVYTISNIRWLSIDRKSASCIYEYTFQGTHNGKRITGKGKGTQVIQKVKGKWLVVHEQLTSL